MASVQELLLAAQSKSQAASPLAGLLQSVGQGVGTGIQGGPDRLLTMMKIQETADAKRRQDEMNQRIAKDLAGNTEDAVKAGLSAASGERKSAAPATKFKRTISLSGGNYTEQFVEETAPAKSTFQELSQEEDFAVNKALSEGRLAPAQITRGPKLKALARQFLANPEYNAAAADTAFTGGKAQASATGTLHGGKGMATEAATRTLDDALEGARQYVYDMSPSQVAVINDAFTHGKQIFNDPAASAYLIHMNEAVGLYSQVLMAQGAPTDMARTMAKEAIGKGLTPDSFDAMASAIRFIGESRAKRLSGKLKAEDELPIPHAGGGPAPKKGGVEITGQVGQHVWKASPSKSK